MSIFLQRTFHIPSSPIQLKTYAPSFFNPYDKYTFVDIYMSDPLPEHFLEEFAEKGCVLSCMESSLSPPQWIKKRALQLKNRKDMIVMGWGKGSLAALYAYVTFPHLYKTAIISFEGVSFEAFKKLQGLMHFHIFLEGLRLKFDGKKLLLIHISKMILKSLIHLGIDFDLLLPSSPFFFQDQGFREKIYEYINQAETSHRDTAICPVFS